MPNSSEIMKIPGKSGKPVEVKVHQVAGDTKTGIRFELELNEVGDMPILSGFIQKGGRVFVTESDSYMLVKPEGDEVDFPSLG